MTVAMPYIPPSVYLLADNLDAALAAGEDLLKANLTWSSGSDLDGDLIARHRAEQRSVLNEIRTLEQVLLARVLKSRERAEEIGKKDTVFGPIVRLYSAGTALLIEAVAEFGDPMLNQFETGDGAIAYLRSRGLLSEDDAAPCEGRQIIITEDFLVARRIRLGTLLDLVAMFLDTLETQYDLFGDDAPESDLLPGEQPLAEETIPTKPATV